jgi:hypothetical protein
VSFGSPNEDKASEATPREASETMLFHLLKNSPLMVAAVLLLLLIMNG